MESKKNISCKISDYFGVSKIFITFVMLVPAKPLNNAQIGGAFYFIPAMLPFHKTYSSPEELVSLLKSRGMIIDDEKRAAAYIRNIGYYRLSAYMYPFLITPKSNHIYKSGTTFDNILDLYRFDKKLRVLLFNEIEKVEIAFREAVANITAEMSGDIYWTTNASHFRNQTVYSKTFALIQTEYNKSTEDFIKHFKDTYSEPFAPAWMISEIIPFGMTVQLYKNLSDQRIRKSIAKRFYLHPQAIESWITTLALTRNACCHHSRVWNKVNLIIPAEAKHITKPWITIPVAKERIYFNICIIKYFLDIISPNNDFKNKLIALFGYFPQIDIKAMGFPQEWQNEPLWK